jgi:methionyl-tRNA formyltransferase
VRPRAIFFGSPEFAVPSLEALARLCEVRFVVTQPDRPAGRGLALRPPAVKVRAENLGLPVWQPTKVRDGELSRRIRAEEADVGIVVAYGRILPADVLHAPRRDCLNVHASLLPRWRGAAPIQWAIAGGDRETGVCLMKMDEGLDTGPLLACDRTPIGPDETAGDLASRLAPLGAALVERKLSAYLAGELEPAPQAGEPSYAPLLSKAHGRIDWNAPAQKVHDLVRGMSPWPGAHTLADGKRVKIWRTHVTSTDPVAAEPGAIVSTDGRLEVACHPGTVAIEELQLEGRKRLPADRVLAGGGFTAVTRLGERES